MIINAYLKRFCFKRYLILGKPKLFIIQACQGILLDDGFSFDDPASCLNNIETCSVMNVPNKKIDYFAFKPLGEPDFFIALSTPPGKVHTSRLLCYHFLGFF